ncbi:MAG: T9SS type A sorting domain-containing protein [Cryomorphaceae bacterium]
MQKTARLTGMAAALCFGLVSTFHADRVMAHDAVSTDHNLSEPRTIPVSLTSAAAGTPPSITTISEQAVCRGSDHGGAAFTVEDIESDASALTVTATSSNTALVPLAGIAISGSGAARTVTVSPAAGVTGTAIIELTVTDEDGLTAAHSFDFTVRELPEVEVTATPASCSESNDGSAVATVTGGQTPYTYEWSNEVTTAELVGINAGLYDIEATDAHGCRGNAQVEVDEFDAVAPVAEARDFTIELGESGQFAMNALQVRNFADNGSTDNCGIDNTSFALSTMTFDCSHLGEHSYVFSVSDLTGNTATREIFIDVVDPHRPTAVAVDLELELDADGAAVLDVDVADAGSFDNCAIVGRSLSKTNFNCGDIGSHDVVLTVSDAQGNTRQAGFVVDVVDAMAPEVEFAATPRVYLNVSGLGLPEQEHIIGTLNDNCGISSTSFSIEEFDCSNLGSTPMTFTAQDFNGNITEISGNVQVVDTIKPTFDLSSITLQIGEDGNAALTEEVLMPHVWDGCGIADIAIQKTSWNCDESGNTTEVVVFDMNGNAVQRTIEVILEDNVPPVVTTEDLTVSLNSLGAANLTLDIVDYTATDNCQMHAVKIDPSRVTCEDGDSAEVTITAWDASGNMTTSTFTVTILDEIAPTIDCSNFTSVCAGPYDYSGMVIAGDNCSATLMQTAGPQIGEVLEIGQHFVEFMAVDPSGNMTTCSTTVEVVESPEVDLGEDFELGQGQSIALTAGDDPDNTYLWSTGQTTSEIIVTVEEDVTISVTVTNANGCAVTDEVTITSVLGLSTATSESGSSFKVYPNPSTDRINLSFGLKESLSEVVISVFDLQGKLLMSEQFNNIENGRVVDMNINHLPQGLYMATVTTENERMTARFSKK